jgi:hypothetical protein
MKEKMTKSQKRLDKEVDKILNEIFDYLFGTSCEVAMVEPEDTVLYDVLHHRKWSEDSEWQHFLSVLDIQYLVAKPDGEYTEYFWLQSDFTCIFVTNDAM